MITNTIYRWYRYRRVDDCTSVWSRKTKAIVFKVMIGTGSGSGGDSYKLVVVVMVMVVLVVHKYNRPHPSWKIIFVSVNPNIVYGGTMLSTASRYGLVFSLNFVNTNFPFFALSTLLRFLWFPLSHISLSLSLSLSLSFSFFLFLVHASPSIRLSRVSLCFSHS